MEEIVPLPQNLTVVHDRDSIIIRRRWFTPIVFFLVFFAVVWNGFMVSWMTMALTNGTTVMAAFGSIHAFVGLGLIYFCFASFINKTDVSVDPNHVKVRHYPVPWPGNKQIQVFQIKQLFTKEHVSRSKNGVNISYAVHVVTDDGREQKLLSGLSDDNQARFIEREIESILGLKDIRVAGEYR